MIITINTKEDSKEEIKKVIEMLMALVKEGSSEFNPVVNEGVFGLFDQQKPEETKEKEPEEKIEIYDY